MAALIYFIQAGEDGPIKVGYTENDTTLVKRVKTLQVANAEPLTLLASVADGDRDGEAKIHAAFHGHSLQGEWFAPSPGLLALIAEASDPDPDPVVASLPWWPTTERRGRPVKGIAA